MAEKIEKKTEWKQSPLRFRRFSYLIPKSTLAVLYSSSSLLAKSLTNRELPVSRKHMSLINDYGLRINLFICKSLNEVFKLVKIDETPSMKQSSYKATYPG